MGTISILQIVKKVFITSLILFGLVIIVLLILWWNYFAAPRHIVVNEPRIEGGAAVIQLDSSKSITVLAQELEDMHIIKSRKIFLTLIEKLRIGSQIKSGVYVFSEPKHVLSVISRLQSGDYGYTPVKITFPEGYTSYAMAEAVNQKFPHIDKEEFKQMSVPLEGKLFPDTYFFYTYVTPDAIIKTLNANFERKMSKLKDDFAIASSTQNRSFDEIITMASILEKEVQTAADKAMVADLFWRRIKNGMPLQADSTLTYVTGKDSFELTKSDLLNKDNVYNSYTHKGLPPTPISNPGLVSIQAALNPVSNPYVFFLSDKEGNTHFSKTYQEHLLLKQKYLR